MSLAVNSYLIPIQLCGGKKTKCHRYKCIHDISVFLPRFYNLPRYCDDEIRSILRNHFYLYFLHRYRIENGIEVVHVNKARLSFHGIERTCSHCSF